MENKTVILTLKRSDAQGSVESPRGIAEDNRVLDIVSLRRAAEQGDADAQFMLAELFYRRYDEGDGLEDDLAEAVKWYQEAAGHGHAGAQFEIGWCYQSGNGVGEPPEKAVEWYRIAADQGYAPAQYWLGWCCRYGKGTEADPAEAVRWFRRAAEQGYEDAMEDLMDQGCSLPGCDMTV